jgi:REP element-mobilizing transposase RayT
MGDFCRRKSIRLKKYDYSSDGYYFVTICTYRNRPIIAQYREDVESVLQSLPNRFPNLTIDWYELMPTHVHVVFIFRRMSTKLGDVVRVFKALVTRQTEKLFWQRNYYEHVIRNEEALLRIRNYIKNNPSAARIDFEQFYERMATEDLGRMKPAPTDRGPGRINATPTD